MIDRVGPYSIERELGRGGMGIVYLGTDSRLDRRVAIKALPAQVADDPDRLARFEREARTLAQISHPNIAGIHGVEEEDGARYLVLEFVDGETLADILDRGPLALDEAIEYATGIAAGLEAAHEAGVIHRDLKPGNIIITPTGVAKILDFGLARTEERASSSSFGSTEEPTLTTPPTHRSPTTPGAILGTAAYMSPEQARGRAVDRRADVWSFGVVLFEMLTGASPFVGETISDSIGAILHKQVDLSLLPAHTPPSVRRVLSRCVERDKAMRYRDVGDVRVELIRSREEQEETVVAPAEVKRSSVLLAAAIVLPVLAGLGSWLALTALQQPDSVAASRFDIVVERSDEPIVNSDPQISPDGTRVAYQLDGVVYVRDLGSFDSRSIDGTSDAINLFWSPNGAWIGYHTQSDFFKVPIAGGTPIKLNSAALTLATSTGGGWTTDDRIVYCSGPDGLSTISARGGEPAVILPVSDDAFDYHDLTVSAAGDVLTYIIHYPDFTFGIGVLHEGRNTVIDGVSGAFMGHAVYCPSGRILYCRADNQRSIWGIDFNLERMESEGSPYLVEPDAWQPTTSRDGSLVFERGKDPGQEVLTWLSRDSVREPIGTSFDSVFKPMLSPDGTRLAFAAGTQPSIDVWVRDLKRGVNTRITFDPGFMAPIGWSPDGRELAIANFEPATDRPARTLFRFTDGSGESRPDLDILLWSLTPDWRLGAGTRDPASADKAIFLVDLESGEIDESPLFTAAGSFITFEFHPNGEFIAYQSSESGEQQIYVSRIGARSGRWQVSVDGGSFAQWSPDGSSIYFLSANSRDLLEAEVGLDEGVTFGIPKPVFVPRPENLILGSGYSISATGDRFAVVEAPEGDPSDRTSLAIIQNWAASLDR